MNLIWALVWNVGTYVLMLREKSKWRPHKDLSTNAVCRGGSTRSSYEAADKAVEQRGRVIRFMV